MKPLFYVLEVGGFSREIGTYGVCLATAIFVMGFLATRAAWRAGMDVGRVIAVIGYTAGGGLAGGFSMFVLVESLRTGDPMAALTQGGLVFYGSPIGGGLAAWFACRQLGVDFGRLLDVSVFAIPIGHAIGRLGCFFGGCCYGAPWAGRWAIVYTDPMAPGSSPMGMPRHPTPLYEAGLLLLFGILLFAWPKKRIGTGQRAGAYLVGYAVIRTCVEVFRGDHVRGVYFGGIVSTSQLISMAMFSIGLLVLYHRAPQRVPLDPVHA